MAREARPAKDIVLELRSCPFEDIPAVSERYRTDARKAVQSACATALRRYEKERRERTRVEAMYELERTLGGNGLILGVDEVGRGSVAGPLTVAAVALPAEPKIWGLNDSKQLTPEHREELAARIAEVAVAIGMAHIAAESIDALGMHTALRMAMKQAIDDAGVDPACVLIDGNPVHVHPREKTLVKGDARVAAIAAASIMAKVTRDHMMVAYDELYPGYHLAECKGYGSQAHIEAIQRLGLSPIHRKSFCGNFLK
ncbi:MAG: ribonuclease HII [Atopobiaceae bacterium]|jgi:ribonuclease HII